METFDEFIDRIKFFKANFELPEKQFEVNPSLKIKVDKDNKFKPLFGDTAVFDLSDISVKGKNFNKLRYP